MGTPQRRTIAGERAMTVWRGWLVLLALLAPLAQAAAPSTGSGRGLHAFLDRNRVSLGDTVTLNIQTDGSLGSPELSSLQKDFEVLGTSRSSSVQIVNGKTTSTVQLGIALKPLHAGTLTVPALGNPSADGARLVPLDRDHRYVTQRDGFTYKVIERSWALIPQRSGSIAVQGPVFEGQRLDAGFPNAWFNNPNALPNSPLQGFGGAVRAAAPVARIDARAQPANAGKPWLPARNVQLKLAGLPSDGKVDAATPLTVTLSISASGQPADALPEPELPTIAGARVYPDRTQDTTDDSGEWLQGTRTRSFAIVPDRNGTLAIPAITLDWWDTSHDRAEQASVPAHVLAVSGVSAGVPAPPAAGSSAQPAEQATRVAARDRDVSAPDARWRDLALASFALWWAVVVAALAWWIVRRRTRRAATPFTGGDDSHSVSVGVSPASARHEAAPGQPDARALQKRTLDAARAGDAAACERTLLAWARVSRPAIAHAGLLRDALADPAQREALDVLQRVRWLGGDPAPACAEVARGFAHGFAWREDERRKGVGANGLPPLYPSR